MGIQSEFPHLHFGSWEFGANLTCTQHQCEPKLFQRRGVWCLWVPLDSIYLLSFPFLRFFPWACMFGTYLVLTSKIVLYFRFSTIYHHQLLLVLSPSGVEFHLDSESFCYSYFLILYMWNNHFLSFLIIVMKMPFSLQGSLFDSGFFC